MPNPFISIRPSGQLGIDVGARADQGASLSETARRDLGRYYESLRRSLPSFTEAEAELIVTALNGSRHRDPESIGLLWAEVANVNEEATAFTEMMLRNLSYIECAAVVDAVERFWAGPYHKEGPIGPRLREVGLVRDEVKR